MFWMQYTIGEKKYPLGAGRSKDLAIRRAASRTFTEIENVPLREHIRGAISEVSFGTKIAEVAWETFGILCEEMEHDSEFCCNSELCAFILEDKETGYLRTLSVGTGNGIPSEQWRVRFGESIIDCHALVIARRCLLLFFYDHLLNLIKKEGESIFQFSGSDVVSLVCLKDQYEIHLYMKNPPCGEGT